MGSCSSVQKAPASIVPLNKDSLDTQASQNTTNLKTIDHLPTFAGDSCSSIHTIEICGGRYITGIRVNYIVDFRLKTMDIFGTGNYCARNMMKFEENEFIDSLIVYMDQVAVTGMKLTTTKGKRMTFGDEDNRPLKKEINLRDTDKVIVGFKGVVGEYLKDLDAYHAQIDKDELNDTISSQNLID